MRPPEDVFNMLNSDIQKCTPDVPRCVRCTLLGIEECVYRQRKERKVGNSLRMGEACLSCRSVFRRIRGQSHATQVLICDTVPPRKRKRVSPQSPLVRTTSELKYTRHPIEMRRQTSMHDLRQHEQDSRMHLRESVDVSPPDEEDPSGGGCDPFACAWV